MTRFTLVFCLGWLLACGGIVTRQGHKTTLKEAMGWANAVIDDPTREEVEGQLRDAWIAVDRGEQPDEYALEVDSLAALVIEASQDGILDAGEMEGIRAAAQPFGTAVPEGADQKNFERDLSSKRVRAAALAVDRKEWEGQPDNLVARFQARGWMVDRCYVDENYASVSYTCSAERPGYEAEVWVEDFEEKEDAKVSRDHYIPGVYKLRDSTTMFSVEVEDLAASRRMSEALLADGPPEATWQWLEARAKALDLQAFDYDYDDTQASVDLQSDDFDASWVTVTRAPEEEDGERVRGGRIWTVKDGVEMKVQTRSRRRAVGLLTALGTVELPESPNTRSSSKEPTWALPDELIERLNTEGWVVSDCDKNIEEWAEEHDCDIAKGGLSGSVEVWVYKELEGARSNGSGYSRYGVSRQLGKTVIEADLASLDASRAMVDDLLADGPPERTTDWLMSRGQALGAAVGECYVWGDKVECVFQRDQWVNGRVTLEPTDRADGEVVRGGTRVYRYVDGVEVFADMTDRREAAALIDTLTRR